MVFAGDNPSGIQCPVSGCEQFHWILEQLFPGGFAGIPGAEETFIGRVLEEAPHEVGHAGQQGA